MVYESYARQYAESWLGYGVSYRNPVEEAEYLSRTSLGPKLYNIFDSGGYLLWRLYPQYRVMVDSRSFPYLGWFRDQYDFANGEIFDKFLAKYPADVAIIDHLKGPVWRNFARSPEWRLVFYGPAAAVFVRRGAAGTDALTPKVADGIGRMRNAAAGLRVFEFAVFAGDYVTAWRVADQLQSTLERWVDDKSLLAVQHYRAAHREARAGLYPKHSRCSKARSREKSSATVIAHCSYSCAASPWRERARVMKLRRWRSGSNA